jgi:perosamine synthetase
LTAVSHPSPTFGDILAPCIRPASKSLLNTDGLELTYNGRGALLRACTEIASRGKRNILLPAYHCPSGIIPAIHAGLQPVFYRVRRDLSIDFDDVLAKTDANTAAVLIIHYFGVTTDLQPLKALQERGIHIIEDWSHSFIQGAPPRLSGSVGDYRIYSFWKLVPTMVGGGLWRRHEGNKARPTMPAPPLRERAVRLKRMFEEALNHSNHERAKALFARIEAIRVARHGPVANGEPQLEQVPILGESHYPFDLTLANSRMPGLAHRILASCDFPSLAQRRRDNFNQYGRLLVDSNQLQILYPALPPETCPWVFPVLLKNRDEIDHRWRAAGVALHTFGIYLHSALFSSTDATTVADAKYLAEHLLCLAVHQDLGTEQIKYSAGLINQYLAKPG